MEKFAVFVGKEEKGFLYYLLDDLSKNDGRAMGDICDVKNLIKGKIGKSGIGSIQKIELKDSSVIYKKEQLPIGYWKMIWI